jgi:hypothetical protein
MAVAGAIQAIQPHSQTIFNRGTIAAKEKASGTWVAGALLVLNGGYVEEAGTAPSTVKYIAMEDGHNASADGTDCAVWPITTGDLWEITYKTTLAQSEIGNNVGLVRDSTTKAWYGDASDTADQMVIEQFVTTPQLGATGDTYYRALARFQAANIAGT